MTRFNPLHGTLTIDPVVPENAFDHQTLKERQRARTDTVFNLMSLNSQLESLENSVKEASVLFTELDRVIDETNKKLLENLRNK